MKADTRFLKQPKDFWANVRLISQQLGYTEAAGRIRVPDLEQIRKALAGVNLGSVHLISPDGATTQRGDLLLSYFRHRAGFLYDVARPKLMDAERAKREYNRLRRELRPGCPLPMNKQKREKKAPAYLTGIVNMLVEKNTAGFCCDYDPRKLTTFTRNSTPLRTLARRVDGAFPGTVDPIAVWEIKEYYYTTTFGSRVADGVYETLLDGMELEELREHEGIDVRHYLMVDGYYTWWDCGRSYLCRIVDALHMGYIDEVFFGSEVLERLPSVVKHWLSLARKREPAT